MPRPALGREIVLSRRSLPLSPSFDSTRIIPIEPDELWDAIDIRVRMSAVKSLLGNASGVRAVGLASELRRDEGLLGALLERIGLDGSTFESRMNDTPPVVTAVKVAPLALEESPLYASIDNPNDLVVSIRGRGFNFVSEFFVRVDYTNTAGEPRTIPMVRSNESVDFEFLEFTALAPLSDFDVEIGSVVTFISVVKMRSGRQMERAFERFTVV